MLIKKGASTRDGGLTPRVEPMGRGAYSAIFL